MGAFFPPECRSPLVALTCMGSFLRCQFNSNFPLFDGTTIPAKITHDVMIAKRMPLNTRILVAVYPPCRSVCEAVVLGCTAFFESQGMKKVQPSQFSIVISNEPHTGRASYYIVQMLPDCDMIDNSTGTPFPAFPPDGTQCVAMPPDMCTPGGFCALMQ
jgi:hypothetical protein